MGGESYVLRFSLPGVTYGMPNATKIEKGNNRLSADDRAADQSSDRFSD